jgi:hypothetical protein
MHAAKPLVYLNAVLGCGGEHVPCVVFGSCCDARMAHSIHDEVRSMFMCVCVHVRMHNYIFGCCCCACMASDVHVYVCEQAVYMM